MSRAEAPIARVGVPLEAGKHGKGWQTGKACSHHPSPSLYLPFIALINQCFLLAQPESMYCPSVPPAELPCPPLPHPRPGREVLSRPRAHRNAPSPVASPAVSYQHGQLVAWLCLAVSQPLRPGAPSWSDAPVPCCSVAFAGLKHNTAQSTVVSYKELSQEMA